MASRIYDLNKGVPEDFFWMNEPDQYIKINSGLQFQTSPETDFWQRTHYGFRNNNGHSLVTNVENDFTMTLCCGFDYSELYHQAGIILYIDENNWIKASIEYENEEKGQLGSVVTNLGWSDWAISEVSSRISRMWYRLHKRGGDCALESSMDNENWSGLRVAHLHLFNASPHPQPIIIRAGFYACSPLKTGFEVVFESIKIEDCSWEHE